MKAIEPKFSIGDVRAHFRYEAATGHLFWLKTLSRRAMAGARAGSGSHGYISVGFRGKQIPAHVIIWFLHTGVWPGKEIDHINGDRSDNRIENLRLATDSEQQCNRRMDRRNSSGVKGVYWNKKAGKWQAYITKHGRITYLGIYNSIDDAKAARARAEERLHGEFVRAPEALHPEHRPS